MPPEVSSQIEQLISNINSLIIAPIILLLFVLSIVVFFWGLAKFISNADNETERETGKKNMIWGIIGIFVMVSAWGIILIAIKTFGIAPPEFPAGMFNI